MDNKKILKNFCFLFFKMLSEHYFLILDSLNYCIRKGKRENLQRNLRKHSLCHLCRFKSVQNHFTSNGNYNFSFEKGYTPNGVVVTTLSTGVMRMFVGQTEPYAAILVYDNNGNGFELFKELKTDGSEDSIGTIPENKELRVFCDGISLHNGFIYTSCSGVLLIQCDGMKSTVMFSGSSSV